MFISFGSVIQRLYKHAGQSDMPLGVRLVSNFISMRLQFLTATLYAMWGNDHFAVARDNKKNETSAVGPRQYNHRVPPRRRLDPSKDGSIHQ